LKHHVSCEATMGLYFINEDLSTARRIAGPGIIRPIIMRPLLS